MFTIHIARKPTATSDRKVEAVVTAPDYRTARTWALDIEQTGREAWIGIPTVRDLFAQLASDAWIHRA